MGSGGGCLTCRAFQMQQGRSQVSYTRYGAFLPPKRSPSYPHTFVFLVRPSIYEEVRSVASRCMRFSHDLLHAEFLLN